jgi:hypothetical protein
MTVVYSLLQKSAEKSFGFVVFCQFKIFRGLVRLNSFYNWMNHVRKFFCHFIGGINYQNNSSVLGTRYRNKYKSVSI